MTADRAAAPVRVVVVDDDDDLRTTLVETLELAGYEVYASGLGTEALAHLERGAPADIILLDLMMPDLNGWEFCARRAENPTLARIPVIAITARRQYEKPIGVGAVVHKPFEITTLLRVMREQLATTS